MSKIKVRILAGFITSDRKILANLFWCGELTSAMNALLVATEQVDDKIKTKV